MRTLWFVLCISISLSAGAAPPYQPRAITEPEAYAVISTVVSANGESPYLNSNYLGFRSASDAAPDNTPQEIGERIYFNSLGAVRLHQRGGHYLVSLDRVDGTQLRSFRLSNLQQAQRLIDALHYYRGHAPAFNGFK